jgi:hypothetical protein
MFEWFYELFVQFVTMVLSWFGMDAKALLGESFKEQVPSGEENKSAESTASIAQNVAQVLNEGEQ